MGFRGSIQSSIGKKLENYGSTFYCFWRRWQDIAANVNFANSALFIGTGSQVRHPFYLHNPQHIKIGENFYAGPGLRLEAWDDYFGHKYKPEIVIGNNVVINFNVHIGAIKKIIIEDDVLIGSNVLITDHSHGRLTVDELDIPAVKRSLFSKGPVVIERNVWIGEGVCILAGVHVGRNSVIGSNAVVTHDIPPGHIVAGIPAKVLCSIDKKVNGIESGAKSSLAET